MDILVQILLNAVIAGAIYTLIALGFTLMYSTAKFFDLGYGALIAVGGYATYWAYKQMDLPVWLAIGIGVAAAGLLAFLVERFIYRKLRERKASGTILLIASLGVLTIIQAVIAIIFSSQFQTLSKNIGSTRTFNIAGGVITDVQALIFISGLVIMTVVGVVLARTLFGKAVRAVADDSTVASIVGINSPRILGIVAAVGGAIGGLSGIAVGFDTGIEPLMGMSLLLKGVIAAIIGGIGSIYGAVLGAFLLALIENLGAWQFAGEWKDAIAFAVLIAFLLFRPKGILSK